MRRGRLQRTILRSLAQEPARTTTDLAARLGRMRASVSRTVNELQRRGLVTKKDGWRLTDAGRTLVEEQMIYRFDFTRLTVGDKAELAQAARDNNIALFVRIADRYTVGGMACLPHTELDTVVAQFVTAFQAHTEQVEAANRLIRQALEP